MQNCKNCSKAIFDQLWGEYKCSVKKHVIYPEEFKENCQFYQKGTPAISIGDDVIIGEE